LIPRVLVCGGRDFTILDAYNKVRDFLDQLCDERGWITEPSDDDNYLPQIHIISGMAKGIDLAAVDWAVSHWCGWSEFPADWKQYGNRAGPIRNQQMLDKGKPDLVVAFPGPKSIGTYDMIRRAQKAGVETIVIK